MSPRPAATDLVPSRRVSAAEAGGWQRWRLRYGKLFLRSLAPSPPPSFSAVALGGEHGEAPAAATARSPGPGGRAAGQVLSTPTASGAASLPRPAARLHGCRSAYGVLEVDGLPAGEAAVDAALGRSSRRLQLPGSHALPAPLRASGSAMGTSASGSTALDSCGRVARAAMSAGFLLLVSARGHRGLRPRGSCRRRAPGAGRVPGLGLRGVGRRGARRRAGWVRGLVREGNTSEGSDRSFGGVAGLSWDLETKANCFPCHRASLEEALEVAAGLAAPSGLFPCSAPSGSHLPPFPSLRPLPPRGGAGPGLQRGPRAGAAGALLQLQCHVGMLPQWASGPGARRTLGTAGAPRRAFPRRAQAALPPPLLPGWGGSQFLHAKKKKQKKPFDPLSGAS